MEDALHLAREQFGLNIGFHILFPTITIALAWFLVFFRVRLARTHDPVWKVSYQLWTKVFALTFGMGVVTGVLMSFQFGTNWPGYMQSVGNVAGPLLAYEVLTAFFLEATFLAVMLFGINRVPQWLHVLSTVLVAVGTTLSAFWILALNSWMQTPVGHVIEDGQLIAGSWLQVIFNPSFPYRFTHMMLASGLTGAFLITGLSAWRLLKEATDRAAASTLRTGIVIAAVLAPLQVVVGDLHGLNTLEHQPAKIAAMEAAWETRTRMPLVLFALPNEQSKRNDYAVEIPGLASFVLKHDFDAQVRGIADFAPDAPPVAPVFFAFRVMVGTGVAMLLAAWAGFWLTRRGAIPRRWVLWIFAAMTFAGWVATLAGWLVTEIGRQPWLVTGVLRTADAVGPVSEASLGSSLTSYVLTYTLMLISYIVVLTHLAGKGAEKPLEPGTSSETAAVAQEA
jgi:cytochrome d ubiquinol oxidase subunit I